MAKLVVGVNDLQSLMPNLAKEWHPTKNGGLKPSDFTLGSTVKVWWRCFKHPEHEWIAIINSRTIGGNGCPICAGKKVLKGFNDLETLRPDIVKEWNYERNGDLKPDMVTCGTRKKVWWRCSKHPEHEWEASIYSRANLNTGCPICAGQKVLKGYNDLETLNPDIAKEWNYERNGDLKPDMVTPYSNKKVWWICEKGHEWSTLINDRVNGNTNCPFCSNKKVLKGFNDLATLKPDLVKEWNYEKNGDLTPEMVTCGSNKKVWWKCEKGHEWKAVVYSRLQNSGCPICSGHQVLAGFNDLATLRPDLAMEWNYERNGDLKPDMVTLYSNKKVWWRCSKHPEHEWEASICNRTNLNSSSGCPICSGHQVLAGFNDLTTLRPDIVKEWNYERNGDLKPDMVTPYSNKKVWWICEKGHEWKSRVADRANGNGCPICSNKKLLVGYNDLMTLYPNLANEWHPTKNGELTPDKVIRGSRKYVWWQCKKNPKHEWRARVSDRITGTNCPHCAKERMVSFPEKIIAYYLKKILPIRENIFIDKWNVDILIENVVIEYDGEYFHSKFVEKDNLKNKDLESEGYTVIRILGRDKSDYVKKSEFRYEIQESNHEHFKTVIKDLCDYLRVDCPDIDVKRDEKEIRKLMDGY